MDVNNAPLITYLKLISINSLRRKRGRGQVFFVEEVRVGKAGPSITDGPGFADALRLDDDGRAFDLRSGWDKLSVGSGDFKSFELRSVDG